MEYTRLDQIIDVMFTTATDLDIVINADDEALTKSAEAQDQHSAIDVKTRERKEEGFAKGTWEFTDSRLLEQKREDILQAAGKKIGEVFIKKSRALYWGSSHENRVACSISKRYTKPGSYRYWYAFHPQWDEFLREGKTGYFILGCMDQSFAFCIPWQILNPLLAFLNTTTTERSTYWHIHCQ